MDMDMKRLNHFIALAEEGRFALGAKRVHLSQAAFSRSIQALEEQLDLRLIDRGAGGARLTPAGETLLERARTLLFESRCLQRDIALIKSGDVGEITIGVAPVPASVILPTLLSRLIGQHPKLIVRIRMGNLQKLLEQLDAQEIDFCLGDPRLISTNSRYAMVSLDKYFGGLYCRNTHPLARKGEIDADALRKYGVATIALTPALQQAMAKEFGLEAATFPEAVECDDVNTLVHLATHTNVIGLLPHAIFVQGRQKLRQLRFAGANDFFADVHAMWLKGRTLAPAAQRAVQLAREVSEELIRELGEVNSRKKR